MLWRQKDGKYGSAIKCVVGKVRGLIHLIGVTSGKEEKNGAEALSEDVMTKNILE